MFLFFVEVRQVLLQYGRFFLRGVGSCLYEPEAGGMKLRNLNPPLAEAAYVALVENVGQVASGASYLTVVLSFPVERGEIGVGPSYHINILG